MHRPSLAVAAHGLLPLLRRSGWRQGRCEAGFGKFIHRRIRSLDVEPGKCKFRGGAQADQAGSAQEISSVGKAVKIRKHRQSMDSAIKPMKTIREMRTCLPKCKLRSSLRHVEQLMEILPCRRSFELNAYFLTRRIQSGAGASLHRHQLSTESCGELSRRSA